MLLGGGRADLVEFAVSLQGRIDDLHRAVDEIAAGLSRVDRRVDGSLTNTAVVRYDAYAGTGGHQSASFAFLDSTRTGTVVTAIQGRDYARLYVKELERGRRRSRSRPRSRKPSSARWPVNVRAGDASAGAGLALDADGAASSLASAYRRDTAVSARSGFELKRLRWYLQFELQQVLVLNASYEPLNVCSVRRAHVLVWKGKAEVIESLPKGLHSATDTFVWPHVIRLVQYVRVPRAIQRKISRRALFARDGWRCVYCGATGGRLTLDHVVPRSRGGESIWENVVTACAPCNLRKGDRLLEECGLHLSGRRGRRRRCSSSISRRRRSRRSGSNTYRARRPPRSGLHL